MTPLTEKEREAIANCIERLNENIGIGDCEGMHADSDAALIDLIENLGLHNVVAAYKKVVDSASWWAYA